MNVRQETIKLLRGFGMTTVFGNPGSTELPFLGEWPQDFRYVLGLQEASVVAMADGFAQATRKPVLVQLHAAAGVGNGLGNLFTAYRNRTPLVVLAGQQPRPMLPGRPFLAGDAPREFPKPYVKWSAEPARAEDVPELIFQAIRMACQPPRGPTFISVPADDWSVPAQPVLARPLVSEFVASPQTLQQIADVVSRAARPGLVVGPGIDRDGAWDEMVALAERLQAPVWAAPVAGRCSFREDHPLFMGVLPPLRQRIIEILTGRDVIIVIGAPLFTYHIPSAGDLAAIGAEIFQLTDDAEEASTASIGTSVLTTLKPALAGLNQFIPKVARPGSPGPPRAPQPRSGNPLTPDFILWALERVLPKDAVIVEEAPSHRTTLQRYIPIKTSGGFYSTGSGGMGFGLAAAVGVALADPSRRVVAVLGDGASQYTIHALWNAAQLKLPILFLILNNASYAALKMLSVSRYETAIPGVDLPGIDLVKLAQGYGCSAKRVQRAEQIVDALAHAIDAPGPFLLEVTVAPPDGPLY